jgi:hypothetical protein
MVDCTNCNDFGNQAKFNIDTVWHHCRICAWVSPTNRDDICTPTTWFPSWQRWQSTPPQGHSIQAKAIVQIFFQISNWTSCQVRLDRIQPWPLPIHKQVPYCDNICWQHINLWKINERNRSTNRQPSTMTSLSTKKARQKVISVWTYNMKAVKLHFFKRPNQENYNSARSWF